MPLSALITACGGIELAKVDATYVSSEGRRKHTCTEQMPAANGGLLMATMAMMSIQPFDHVLYSLRA